MHQLIPLQVKVQDYFLKINLYCQIIQNTFYKRREYPELKELNLL
ncbi:unnamed protein product [Paramecium primaurelia]|uniref:Uncharacterized protein n=2 Tax=Paramecium TaxID=5884 RepID=A0A8S1WY19_9CILI|nr:unnamed protein product [Paramecium primaurelia]CAD8194838.1 unnamed protein product [Paramecium pentaurelia]